MFIDLSQDELVTASGGGSVVTDPIVCTPDNPSGQRIYHQSVRNPAPEPSRTQRTWQWLRSWF